MTPRQVALPILLAAVAAALGACSSSGPTSAPPLGSSSAPTSATASSTPSASTAASSTPVPAATESSPPGDIPDNQAFVTYKPGSRVFTVKVPEGWARTASGSSVTFTDKLNSVTAAESAAAGASTVASATSIQVPQLAASEPRFVLGKVAPFSRDGGSGVLITYLSDSPPNPVTAKVVRNASESFLFWKNGALVTLTLTGPQNADNVDPWAKVSGSFRWTA